MHRTSRIKQALALALLMLPLAGGSLSLAAQQGNQPQPPEKAPAAQSQDAGDSPSAPPAGAGAGNDPTAKPPEEDANNSPFDYQPSEKISEDLSVSFPVDI